MTLGTPRVHYRMVQSTNRQARALASRGAPHGTVVTADEQSAGRGRQGRTWTAPGRQALLCSLIVRDPPRLLPLLVGVAVAEEVGANARVKWPNDVLLDGRKVAGILVEGRPQEGWMVVGIGLNVAVSLADLPPALRERAGSLDRSPEEIEPTLARLLERLEEWLAATRETLFSAWQSRDALAGEAVHWPGGRGRAAGIDDSGRLIVMSDGKQVMLEAGEVHLG